MKVLFLIFLFPLSFFCQGGVIKGKVEAQEAKKIVAGASIYLIGTTEGAASDLNGNYEIKNLLPGKYKIRCSFLGAKEEDKTIVIHQNDTLIVNFNLEEAEVRDSIKISVQKQNIK